MSLRWKGQLVEVTTAQAHETPAVLGILDAASAWLRSRGVEQWPERAAAPPVEAAIARGEVWLARIGGEVAATLRLDWADPLWADLDAQAGYLHQFAVRRRAAGLGAPLVEWAADVARRAGREALRLDCVSWNEPLRRYYEALGFAHRGDVEVRGAPGERAGIGPAVVVSRYERRLSPHVP